VPGTKYGDGGEKEIKRSDLREAYGVNYVGITVNGLRRKLTFNSKIIANRTVKLSRAFLLNNYLSQEEYNSPLR
jgi:hypothetical protein